MIPATMKKSIWTISTRPLMFATDKMCKLSVCLSVSLSVCLVSVPSVRPSVCLSVCPSVRPSARAIHTISVQHKMYRWSHEISFLCSPTGGVLGQQCCYTEEGQLVIGASSGGSSDNFSPKVAFNQHLLFDLVPYVLCCKNNPGLSSCDSYYSARPSGSEIGYSLPIPGTPCSKTDCL